MSNKEMDYQDINVYFDQIISDFGDRLVSEWFSHLSN